MISAEHFDFIFGYQFTEGGFKTFGFCPFGFTLGVYYSGESVWVKTHVVVSACFVASVQEPWIFADGCIDDFFYAFVDVAVVDLLEFVSEETGGEEFLVPYVLLDLFLNAWDDVFIKVDNVECTVGEVKMKSVLDDKVVINAAFSGYIGFLFEYKAEELSLVGFH